MIFWARFSLCFSVCSSSRASSSSTLLGFCFFGQKWLLPVLFPYSLELSPLLLQNSTGKTTCLGLLQWSCDFSAKDIMTTWRRKLVLSQTTRELSERSLIFNCVLCYGNQNMLFLLEECLRDICQRHSKPV